MKSDKTSLDDFIKGVLLARLLFLILGLSFSFYVKAEGPICVVRTPVCETYDYMESIAIFIFKSTQQLEIVINRGEHEDRAMISTGLAIHGGTPSGNFRPSERIKSTRNHCSSNVEYGNGRRLAAMPYSIHFKDGYAIHAGHVTGRPASHGCVRLNESDARKLYCLLLSNDNWQRTLISVQE